MFAAFARTHAQDFELSGQAISPADTRTILTNASELLRLRRKMAAADLPTQLNFEIRHSWNTFEDDFNLLYCSIPAAQYEEVRKFQESPSGKQAFRDLAEVVSELGTYIRFIVIDLSLIPVLTRSVEETARALTPSEINWIVHHYIGVTQGYLGDFSYQSHREFYLELGLEIAPDEYPGTTRARFERILAEAPLRTQSAILGGILSKYPLGSSELRTTETVAKVVSLVVRLGGTSPVSSPVPHGNSAVVERALQDAEYLIGKSGATSAIDRMHTALHGYLLDVCADAGITTSREDTLVTLLRMLRERHPTLSNSGGPRSADITRILKGLGSILDVLNPIRNNASIAHPNEELLADPEAMLAINAARSILHYIDSRLHP